MPYAMVIQPKFVPVDVNGDLVYAPVIEVPSWVAPYLRGSSSNNESLIEPEPPRNPVSVYNDPRSRFIGMLLHLHINP